MIKKITVVVVTFNGAHWIKKNLDSLLKSIYPVSILVIDNASTDHTVAILQEYTTIEVIINETNLGFGKANNIGIARALKNNSDAVFLLNQDTWIFENTISNLAQHLFENPAIGIVSPIHFSSDGSTLDLNFQTYFLKHTKEINSELIRIVPFVNAAAWLVSKECFETVGYFEPFFNHYGEDRNFCDRVQFHNFQIGIVKDVAICHDRIIQLSVSKIVLQSQYLILNQLINCNKTLFFSFLNGLKFVFGLPKFHLQSLGLLGAFQLFWKLLNYFYNLLLRPALVKEIRYNSKMGTNGIISIADAK